MAATAEKEQMSTEEILAYMYLNKTWFLTKTRLMGNRYRDDIFQKTALTLYLKKDDININLKGYIASALYNQARNYKRNEKAQTMKNRPSGVDVISLDDEMYERHNPQTPDKFLQRKQQCAVLQEEINKLTPKQQCYVWEYYIDDQDMTSIAEKYKTNKETVKANWRHGMLKFRTNETLKDKLEIIDWEKE